MVNSLWFKWKALRLPWRKSRLVGQDLSGNTFWEFKDAINTGRWRRIVKFDPRTHYSEVKVSPQWHQWLRYVRENPPSIPEQQQDLIRQAQMKELARLADERWASKPSFLDKPKNQRLSHGTEDTAQNESIKVNNGHATASGEGSPAPGNAAPAGNTESKTGKDESPWAKADAKGPGEGWQPDSWTPKSQR